MSNCQYFVPFVLGLSFLTLNTNATAQLIPDNTLGTENSVVTPIDLLNQRIDGGASRGSNLFHSFLEFNVGNGRGVYFTNPVGIENILTRVTGGNTSNLFGTLGVLGNANLFLINPNGIYFGPNARLEVSGSFLATTADGIQLGSNGYFSATDTAGSQLLSVEPGALFSNALRNYQAEVNNQGNLAVGGNLTLDGDNLNLQGQLQAGGDLTLQATDNVTIRDSATNPFFASAGDNLLVQGNQNVDIFALNHPNSGLYSGGEMVLKSPNSVIGDAHYYSGGNFRIEKLDGTLGNLTSPNDPVIRSLGDVSFSGYIGTSLHIFAAGSVNIPNFVWIQNPDPINGIVENVTLSDGTTVAIDGRNEPTLDIRAGMDAAAVGIPGLMGMGFFLGGPNVTPTPNSADINIGGILFSPQPGTLLLTNQYRPNTALPGGTITVGSITNASLNGNGGNVFIDSRAGINLTNDINTFSLVGNGGDVLLNANDDINVNGDINASNIFTFGGSLGGGGDIQIATSGDAFFNGSTLISHTNGLAKAGDISITARSVQLTNGAQLNTSTRGAGNAGNVNITAVDTVSFNSSSATSRIEPGAVGNGGDINIATGSLVMSNGARLDTTISGMGNGGNINIFARDTVSLDGVNNGLPTAALTNVEQDATGGNAGNVRIEARSLSVTNGALLESRTHGQGNAANIEINVREQVNFSGSNGGWNSGAYSSVELGAVGNGGDVNIDTGSLALANSARLDASTRGAGNAGDVNITAIDAVSFNNSNAISRVEAGATGGNGGEININAGSLSLINQSELSASSLGVGDAGSVNLSIRDDIFLDDSRVFSTMTVDSFGNPGVGNGGDVDVNAGSLVLRNGAALTASTLGIGDAGNVIVTVRDDVSLDGVGSNGFPTAITSSVLSDEFGNRGVGNGGDVILNAGSLSITNNAAIAASTFGIGNSGDVKINVRDRIFLDGSSNRLLRSSITSGVLLDFWGNTGVGNGGNVEIEAGSLSLSNGAAIASSTFGVGNADDVNIKIRDTVSLDGVGRDGIPTAISSGVLRDFVGNTGSLGVGNGGDVNLDAGSLFLTNGAAVLSSTEGVGDAGDVNINVRDTVALDGSDGDRFRSSISSSVANLFGIPGVGDGGNVMLEAGSLFLTNGAAIASSTEGVGNAGKVEIAVRDNGSLSDSFISSAVEAGAEGNGGGINFNARSLSLNNSQVSAFTAGQGDAGSATLTATNEIELNNSTVSSAVEAGAVGSGRDAKLQGNTLSVTNSRVSSSTAGQGDAGLASLTATNAIALNNSTVSSAVEAGAVGNGRNAELRGNSLSLTNSQVFSSTAGVGNAGSAILNANDEIELNGSTVSSAVNAGGVGSGGNAELRGNSLSLTNSRVSSSTAGTGNAGSAILNANDEIELNGSSVSSATSRQGNAGLASLTATNEIELNNSTVSSAIEAGGVGNGSNAELRGNTLSLTNSRVSSSTAGQGDAGSASLIATNEIALNGSTVSSAVEAGAVGSGRDAKLQGNTLSLTNSRVSSSTAGQGDAGLASLTATNEIALNNSTVSSAVNAGGVGDGGNAELQGNTLSLTNSRVSSSTAGRGNAGSAILNANDAIALNRSTVSSAVEADAVGAGGNASLRGNTLSLNNSQVSSSTAGVGNAGSVTLLGRNTISLDNSQASSAVETTGIGNGGRVSAETRILSMSNGSQISSSTAGRGDAGEIALSASDSVTLDNSAILNRAEDTATGNGGNIDLDTGEFTLNDSRISSDNSAAGRAGDINLRSDRNLNLDRSRITATTASGDGGNLNLQANQDLILRDGSLISTTAGEAGSGGNGGNIDIAAFFIIGVPTENSDITANAFEGRGGNITITTNGIYGLQFRPRLTPLSDITASSEFGLDGSFILNLLSFPAERGLNQLPESLVDAESILGRDACALKDDKIAGGSSLVVTGRGGLPTDPAEGLPPLEGMVEWASREGTGSRFNQQSLEQNNNLSPNPAPTTVILRERSPEESDESGHPLEIRPAQGWIIQPDGTVLLTAEAPTPSTYNQGIKHPDCRTVSQS